MSATKKLSLWAVVGGLLGVMTSVLVTMASGTDPSAIVVAILHLAIVGSFVGLWLGMVFNLSSHESANVTRSVQSGTRNDSEAGEPQHATA